MGAEKIIIIGLDGATFDVIKPLIAEGRLPNVKRLMDNGVWGELTSTIHPITPQAWTTFLTGTNAGKHGIYDFTRRRKDSYTIEFVNASYRRGESIFNILGMAGKRVGAVAIPFTFPPERVNGFMLSGMDAPSEDERSVFPPHIFNDIKRNIGKYYIHLGSPVGRRYDLAGYLNDLAKEDKNRTDVSLFLMKKHPCELFMAVYNNIDRAQHQFFTEERFDGVSGIEIINRIYEQADKEIGRLLSEIDDGTTVIIMSDHGAGPIKKFFSLNLWLNKNGFLEYSGKDSLRMQLLGKGRTACKRLLPRWAKNFIKVNMPGARDNLESMLYFSDINWRQTKAYSMGMYGNIWINLKGREPEGVVERKDYEAIRDEIIVKLTILRDPETGESVIEKIYRREELYRGEFVDNAPDLIIGWKDYSYYTSIVQGKEQGDYFKPVPNIDSSDYKHVGTHRVNGIFIASGKNVKKGEAVSGIRIEDIAPTVLFLFDQPVPTVMDGRVLHEILEDGSYGNNKPTYIELQGKKAGEEFNYSDTEANSVRERLKALGYL